MLRNELRQRIRQDLIEQGKKSSSAMKAATRLSDEFYNTQHVFPQPLAPKPTPPQNLVKALRNGN